MVTDRAVRPEHDSGGPSATSSRPVLRWVLGVALGGLAATVNLWQLTILTEETPIFLFGGVFVLVAFVGLGVGPGILAAVISIADAFFGFRHPVVGVGSFVYVFEGLAAYFLYRKTGSLPLSVAIFWFAGGWIWDLALYRVWVGLDPGYIALLFVKQLLNGLINAVGAELILRSSFGDALARVGRGDSGPVRVRAFVFQWVVLLILVPLTGLGLYHVRAQYESVIRDVQESDERMAWEAAAQVDSYLEVRRTALRKLARSVEPGPLDEAPVQSELNSFLERFPDFYAVVQVDTGGVVRRASPRFTITGESVVGLDVGDRDYFRQVRDQARPAYGHLIIGRLQIRSPDVEPAVVLAEPLFDAAGRLTGVLVASLDPRLMTEQLAVTEPDARSSITMVDADGRIIASLAPNRPVGLPLDSVVRGPRGRRMEPFPLADLSDPLTLRYYPPPSDEVESRLALNLVHGSYRPVLRAGWGVLVETPASRLYPRFMPVAFQVVVLVAVVLLLVYLVLRHFSGVLARPLTQAAGTARSITAGEMGRSPGPSRLMDSRLVEARDLGRSLEQMREALWTKERKTRERQQELEAQLLQAQKMEAIGLLAGGVAHDFNNFLTPVTGFSEIGLEDAESEEIREYFEEINRAAQRARNVVRQLLAFSRKQVLTMEVLDLGTEVRQANDLLRPLLREDIVLEFRIEAHPRVHADSGQIQQILLNLGVNAQDAMPRGGRLTLEVRRLPRGEGDLAEEELEDTPLAELRVSDTGEGIPGEELPMIFDPFFTTKEPGKGTGLGLATVYGIVRQHGGAIRVDSVPGVGTTFRIYLPETDLAQSEGEARGRAGAARAESARILLVEDDQGVRSLARRVLEKAGYHVTTAASGEEVLQAHGEEVDFDLLVTDVVLPGMSGRDLHERLSRHRPGLPAAFMSGYGQRTFGGGELPGDTEFLSKPFSPSDLLQVVESTLL